MNKWEKWKLLRKFRDYLNRKMTDAWMQGGNCDSCCLRCKQWESHGNQIITRDADDGSIDRECKACGYQWKTIFTPAGFIPINHPTEEPE